ncbi:nucleoside-diphosphate kinase [Nocardiopsis exhalans]|uniref:Nucleoside-diphosphate kinase n=1 Tax=Nocardiopsis exhalans TaxID=163604 RepID=A0ABY5DCP7_9ACTN|nr:nucleoside-diphosphate kinase [Nocardiopsis exhalans]USY21735.1 nucleoside-diphosphate kinase [Nocardiopsis exhalans]
MSPAGGWGRWTVATCKPDATRRGLVEPILGWIGAEVRLVERRTVFVTERHIFTHYADMLALNDRFPFDVAAELRRNWVGQTITVALFHGDSEGTPERVRGLLGHYDPARATPDTIRGYYGDDSTERARAEGRFIDNLIHTSDDGAGAEREFNVWFGPAFAHLLTPRTEEFSP